MSITKSGFGYTIGNPNEVIVVDYLNLRQVTLTGDNANNFYRKIQKSPTDKDHVEDVCRGYIPVMIPMPKDHAIEEFLSNLDAGLEQRYNSITFEVEFRYDNNGELELYYADIIDYENKDPKDERLSGDAKSCFVERTAERTNSFMGSMFSGLISAHREMLCQDHNRDGEWRTGYRGTVHVEFGGDVTLNIKEVVSTENDFI